MEDRLTRGFAAGIIGGLITNVWSFFAGSMKPTILRFMDWSGIMIFGHVPPFEPAELIIALLGQIVFSGILGIIFAYLVLYISSRNLLFKGWIFSITTWFFIYAVTALFKVEGTLPLSVITVLSNIIGASIFGLTQAFALKILTENLAPEHCSQAAVPARKPLDDKAETYDHKNTKE